jgi:diguanylate cyclase (GGDEF)-like protein
MVISRPVIARLGPFAGAAFAAFALVPIGAPVAWDLYSVALAATFAIVALVVAVPWQRLPQRAQLVLPLIFLGVAALLRHAAGGSQAGVGMLPLLPVFWVALHGTRRQLAVIVLASGAVLAGPVVVIGGDAYPPQGLRFAAIFVVIAGAVGATAQGLVFRLRNQQQALVAREAALQDAALEREKLVAELGRLAHTDPLTGLGNRRAWDGWLDAGVFLAEREQKPLAVAMLDLDHFKLYNDRHGHDAGDRLLAAAAAAWLAELRPGDQLARLGGEEFAVLLLDCPAECAVSVVERLRRATPAGQTCSAGVAAWDGTEAASGLLGRADVALYEAKRSGRDRTRVARRVAAAAAVARHP